MPFVNRREIAIATRKEAEKSYRSQLRKALSNPILSDAQRVVLRSKLDQIGKPRVYDAESPAPPGAIAFEPPKQEFTETSLRGMKKAELKSLAAELDLPISGTKAILVARLLSR